MELSIRENCVRIFECRYILNLVLGQVLGRKWEYNRIVRAYIECNLLQAHLGLYLYIKRLPKIEAKSTNFTPT